MYCGIKRLHSFNFDPAVLQPCGPAALQPCGPATLRYCKKKRPPKMESLLLKHEIILLLHNPRSYILICITEVYLVNSRC
jgi:hypothetical protein